MANIRIAVLFLIIAIALPHIMPVAHAVVSCTGPTYSGPDGVACYTLDPVGVCVTIGGTTTYLNCNMYTKFYISTFYPKAGQGTISYASKPPTTAVPVIGNTRNFNDRNAQWFITCPDQPNPSTVQLYFQSIHGSYVAGDVCLANSNELDSSFTMDTYYYADPFTLAYGQIYPFHVNNVGIGDVTNLAYNGQASNSVAGSYNTYSTNPQKNGPYNISESYSSKSPIYIPTSQNQSQIWQWYAKYVNFGLVDNILPSAAPEVGYGLFWYFAFPCYISYNYFATGSLVYIDNQNLTIPSSPNFDHTQNSYTSWLSLDQGVPVVPFLITNLIIPAAGTILTNTISVLNLNVSIYGPQNFLDANILDPYALTTQGALFTTEHKYSDWGLSSQSTLVLFPLNSVSLTSPQDNQIGSDKANGDIILGLDGADLGTRGIDYSRFAQLGNDYLISVNDPIAIATSPTDTTYILNQSTSGGGCVHALVICLSHGDQFYLYKVQMFSANQFANSSQSHTNSDNIDRSSDRPPDHVNLYGSSSFPDPAVQQGLVDQLSQIYKQYWNSITLEQNGIAYVTAIRLVAPSSFQPIDIATDYQDNVFLLGTNSACGWTCSKSVSFEVYLSSCGTTYQLFPVSLPTGVDPPLYTAFTVSPDGQFLYAATPDQGYIDVFRFIQDKSSPCTKSSISWAGQIDLSYTNKPGVGNADLTFNAISYLAHGGPYGDSAVSQQFANDGMLLPDATSNHHPLALAESQGLLYVLDNWQFSGGGSSTSVMMLRAFAATGTEIPIDAANYNTTINPKLAGQSTITTTGASLEPIGGWPPYGWPLEALVGCNTLTSSCIKTYCANGCDIEPYTVPNPGPGQAYPPVGPSATSPFSSESGGTVGTIGMTSDFNNTLYIVSHTTTPSGKLYAQLLVIRPDLNNYTKTSYAAYSPSLCYVDQVIGDPFSTPCRLPAGKDGTAAISDMYYPTVGVPSAFNYTISQGAPKTFLSYLNTLASIYPSNTVVQQAAISSNPVSDTFPYGSAANTGTVPTPPPAPQFTIPLSYLNTSIHGSFVMGYNYLEQLTQVWYVNGEGTAFGSIEFCPEIDGGTYWSSTYDLYATQTQPFPINDRSSVAEGRPDVALNYSNFLNETVSGGLSYSKYIQNNAFYDANISDKNAILPPFLFINLSTNKLIGELFINLTVLPDQELTDLLPVPYVVNAVHILDYQPNQFTLVSRYTPITGTNGEQLPGYQDEEILPSNPPSGTTGTSCGTSCGAYTGGYYNPARSLLGNKQLTYNTIPRDPLRSVNLFQIYTLAAYYSTLGLNVTGNPMLIGHDRFVYTYVDAFNNIIYQPLDVNLANSTQINFATNVAVDPTNPNQTTISVVGNVLVCSGLLGTHCTPAPEGSDVYLYYDTNLNYYNATLVPAPLACTTPGCTSSAPDYYKWAEQCAFDPTKSCTLAQPLYTKTYDLSDPANPVVVDNSTGVDEADKITFSPQYNALKTCEPQPNSLLVTPNYNECNIYGNFGLSAYKTGPNGQSEYCEPSFANGNGIWTSQLGLFAVVSTDQSGNFVTNPITACGTGVQKVTAAYYGWPPPEPQLVNEPPESNAFLTNQQYINLDPNPIPVLEYSYSASSLSVASTVTIGNYQLGYGTLDVIESASAMCIIFALLLLQYKMRKTDAKP